MDFVAVAIVSAIVLGHPVKQKSRLLIGVNCILLCLNNSNQIAKWCKGKYVYEFESLKKFCDSAEISDSKIWILYFSGAEKHRP